MIVEYYFTIAALTILQTDLLKKEIATAALFLYLSLKKTSYYYQTTDIRPVHQARATSNRTRCQKKPIVNIAHTH